MIKMGLFTYSYMIKQGDNFLISYYPTDSVGGGCISCSEDRVCQPTHHKGGRSI